MQGNLFKLCGDLGASVPGCFAAHTNYLYALVISRETTSTANHTGSGL